MHEHDFVEPFDVEVDEVVIVYQRCQHRPIRGAHHSERLDEVFYDEGPRCEARQTTYYYLESVYANTEHGSVELDIDGWFETDEKQAETAFMEAERSLASRPVVEFDPRDSEISVTVEVESNIENTTDSFTFVYEREEQEVIG